LARNQYITVFTGTWLEGKGRACRGKGEGNTCHEAANGTDYR
jgi:hypothetical protein